MFGCDFIQLPLSFLGVLAGFKFFLKVITKQDP